MYPGCIFLEIAAAVELLAPHPQGVEFERAGLHTDPQAKAQVTYHRRRFDAS